MTSEQQLENLGYKKVFSDGGKIVYESNKRFTLSTIVIFTNKKCFYVEDELGLARVITMPELKAIIDIFKELGVDFND